MLPNFKKITYILASLALAYALPQAADTAAAAPAAGTTAGTAADTAAAPAAGTDAGTAAAAPAAGTTTTTGTYPGAGVAPAIPMGDPGNKEAEVYFKCQQPGKFALTFDDGPDPVNTAKALDFLKQENIKATFFVNAQNYGNLISDPAAQEVVKRAYNEGHTIGSHTYYHRDLIEALKDGTIEDNIGSLNKLVKQVIGKEPVFFRPPNGSGGYTQDYCTEHNIPYDPQTETIRKYLGKYNMKVVMWSADTRDWANKDNVEGALKELDLSLKTPGYNISPATHSFITLIHDVHPYSVETILPAAVKYIREMGYEFISLPECLGQEPYSDGNNSTLNNNSGMNLTSFATRNIVSTTSVFSVLVTLLFLALSL